MASHTEKGIIVKLGPKQNKKKKEGADDFFVQQLVIRTADQYPQYIVFEAHGDRCDLLRSLFENEVVTVHFDLKGRPWTTPEGAVKYLESKAIWKIEFDSPAADPAEDQQTLTELGFDTGKEKEKNKNKRPHNGRINDLPF